MMGQCYLILKDSLIAFLGHYGELLTDIIEEHFDDKGTGDPETEGTNQTGTYIAKVRLERDIPELVPIDGRRIRISYPCIQILCTTCFGKL